MARWVTHTLSHHLVVERQVGQSTALKPAVLKAVTVTTGSHYAAATANRLTPGRVVSGGGSLR